MTQNTSIPNRTAAYQWMRPSLFSNRALPILPSFGVPAVICGFLGIATLLAPQLVESIIPHFRERYLPIVSLVILLALLSSLWRLMKATIGLLFFGAAALALMYSINGGSISQISLPRFFAPTQHQTKELTSSQSQFPSAETVQQVGAYFQKQKLPPALPDEAYFPTRPSSSTFFSE